MSDKQLYAWGSIPGRPSPLRNPFDAIKVAALKVMTAYRSDLDIDARCIAENNGIPFLHYTRETGTVLVFLLPYEKLPSRGEYVPHLFSTIDRNGIIDNMASMPAHIAKPSNAPSYKLVYHFDGRKARKITLETAAEIAKQHAHNLREQVRRREQK